MVSAWGEAFAAQTPGTVWGGRGGLGKHGVGACGAKGRGIDPAGGGELPDIAGEGSGKVEGGLRHRMGKAELPGMECLTTEVGGLFGEAVGGAVSVLVIPEDGGAEGGGMDADLVGAPVPGEKEEQTAGQRGIGGAQNPVGGLCLQTALSLDDTHGSVSALPFAEGAADGAFPVAGGAVGEGEIGFLDGAVTEEGFGGEAGGVGFREEEDAGRIPVKAVAGGELRQGGVRTECPGQRRGVIGGDGFDAGGFVHHEEVGIFVQERHGSSSEGDALHRGVPGSAAPEFAHEHDEVGDFAASVGDRLQIGIIGGKRFGVPGMGDASEGDMRVERSSLGRVAAGGEGVAEGVDEGEEFVFPLVDAGPDGTGAAGVGEDSDAAYGKDEGGGLGGCAFHGVKDFAEILGGEVAEEAEGEVEGVPVHPPDLGGDAVEGINPFDQVGDNGIGKFQTDEGTDHGCLFSCRIIHPGV